MTELLDQISRLPHLPGVYRYFDREGASLYVGKARDLKNRVSSYFSTRALSPRIALMVKRIATLETTVTASETDALLLENHLIKALKPYYNILFRDDKSYPYIKLSAHAYPRMSYFRGSLDHDNQFFGPYPNSDALREAMQLLQKIFQLRTCTDSVFNHRSRPCLLHQIKRCSAPCVNLISADEYRGQIESAARFLRGDVNAILDELGRRMQAYSDALKFEDAAQVRDQITALSSVGAQQRVEVIEGKGQDLNMDILACAYRAGHAVVNVAMVRNGRHLGDRAFHSNRVDLLSVLVDAPEFVRTNDAENQALQEFFGILQPFLMQHYSQHLAPPMLFLSHQPEETVQDFLTRQCGQKIRVLTRAQDAQRGSHKVALQWYDLAQKGALRALNESLLQNQAQQEKLYAALNALQVIAPEDPMQFKVECFDASHTQGEATQVACVVYQGLTFANRLYRRYNIGQKITALNPTPHQGGDDYGALREALRRHYTRHVEKGLVDFPDLVLIDGGKGQVEVARSVFVELGLTIEKIVGISKGEGRKVGLETFHRADGRPPLELSNDSKALLWLANIRDEAHRFAITGMRTSRAKARQHSSLEQMEGIGAKRRQKLLLRFGSLRAVADASVEDIAKVDGISHSLAQKIHHFLH